MSLILCLIYCIHDAEALLFYGGQQVLGPFNGQSAFTVHSHEVFPLVSCELTSGGILRPLNLMEGRDHPGWSHVCKPTHAGVFPPRMMGVWGEGWTLWQNLALTGFRTITHRMKTQLRRALQPPSEGRRQRGHGWVQPLLLEGTSLK